MRQLTVQQYYVFRNLGTATYQMVMNLGYWNPNILINESAFQEDTENTLMKPLDYFYGNFSTFVDNLTESIKVTRGVCV